MNKKPVYLEIDFDKCIGCRACTSSCPNGFIRLSETGRQRTIVFPESCGMDCQACVSACPEDAIRFARAQEYEEVRKNKEKQAERVISGSSEFELCFELVVCRKCKRPFATEKELKRVLEAIDAEISSSEYAWKGLCPSCRRDLLREREARAVLRVKKF